MKDEIIMNILLNPLGKLAIYKQIANHFENAIITGVLREGDALPSIRTLAAELHVGPNTVVFAFKELEKEGFVYSVPGKGFFVCSVNLDSIKENQIILLKNNLIPLINDAKRLGMDCNMFLEMIEILYD